MRGGAEGVCLSTGDLGPSHILLDLSSEALARGFWLWVPGGRVESDPAYGTEGRRTPLPGLFWGNLIRTRGSRLL